MEHILIGVIYILSLTFIYLTARKIIKSTPDEKKVNEPLSFDEINKVLDKVVEEVSNKYILFYKLKEITVIPDMANEIKTMTTEIVNAFSEEMIDSFKHYYEYEYLIAMITRRVQVLLIQYTDANKPNTK